MMTNGIWRIWAAAGAWTLIAAAPPDAVRDDQIGPDRYVLTVRGADLHPATPDAARRTLARIGAAARAACGGSRDRLREIQQTVGPSLCWRRAVAETVVKIEDPLLNRAYRAQP